MKEQTPKERAKWSQSLKDVGDVRDLSLKEEFYKKFAPERLGENQMILLTDEVAELWSWIEQKLSEKDVKVPDETELLLRGAEEGYNKGVNDCLEILDIYQNGAPIWKLKKELKQL